MPEASEAPPGPGLAMLAGAAASPANEAVAAKASAIEAQSAAARKGWRVFMASPEADALVGSLPHPVAGLGAEGLVESVRIDGRADGAEVAMTAMEYELLRVFLANPNRVLSRDQLLMHTRNREWEPFDRSIDIRIGRLRRKIEPEPAGEPRCIRTVRNAGYMFVPDG